MTTGRLGYNFHLNYQECRIETITAVEPIIPLGGHLFRIQDESIRILRVRLSHDIAALLGS